MNLAEFHFIRPYWLLAVFPWLVLLAFMTRHKLQQGNWTKVCDQALLPYILQQKAVNGRRWPLLTGALASLVTIIALAGPAWERLPAPVFRNDSALVIALDLSRSMDAADIKPSRLIRARYKIDDILNQRKDGQTALLVYAGDAFTVTPLTDDTDTIASQLPALTTDIMPSQGSNAAIALTHAVELLKQAGLQQGHILLVTDGTDFDSTESAVQSLGAYDLSILGVGTAAGAPIRAPEGGFVKDHQGNIVVPKLNAVELAKLAEKGRGVYRTISANDNDIAALTSYFDNRVREKSGAQSDLLVQQWAEKGPWLLLLVLPLAALNFRKGFISIVFLLLLPFPKSSYALDWNDLWQTKDQQAYRAFKNEQYDRAATLFENPDWKAAAQYKAGHFDQVLETLKGIKTADSFYNLGNALAKSGQLEQALGAYNKALESNPGHADAKYNKEIVEKALEKQQQQQQPQQRGNDQQKSDQNRDQDKAADSSGQSAEQQASEKKDASESTPADEQSRAGEAQERQHAGQDQNGADKEAQSVQPGQPEQNEDHEQEQSPTEAVDAARPMDETQQANEQWLKRIPDDPAGLLRRKFLYQYGRRGRQPDNTEDW